MPAFEILGTTCQIAQFPLQPGDAITTEPGAMCYMNNGCKLAVETGGLMSMMGSFMGGESPFKCIYTNKTNAPGYVAVTSDIPGVLIPIDMNAVGGSIKCKRGAWVCSTGRLQTEVLAGFNPANSLAGQCCSGNSFIMQELKGGQWSFLAAMGTIISRELGPGEEIIVDTNSVLAMSGGVQVDVRAAGGCGAMCCGGEGMFNTVLTGPGKIWMESMPIEKLRALFPPEQEPGQGGSGGDGGDGGGGE
jgi:uncharacterized protein (AIM24 family)